MLRESYRITINAKMLILKMLLFSFGSTCGLTWEVANYNKKWDNLIYKGIEVNGFHLSSRSVKEDEALIKSQYVDPLMGKKIKIVVDSKSYELHTSNIIKEYDIEGIEGLNQRPTIHDKIKLINEGVRQLYNVKFIFDKNYIESFIHSIEKDLDEKPVNASIKEVGYKNIEINPDINGRRLDANKLEKKITEELKNYTVGDMTIKVNSEKYNAPVTADKLSCVTTKIASFSTDFSSSSEGRSKNIELAARSINGKLIMPEEIFSFNDSVGERTKEKGYMTAPVLADGRVGEGIGGGICQVSSTLYNAILRAGIKPLERAHHTIPSTYVKLGLDATVNWKDIDLKFQNTLKFPMYLEAYTKNKNLYIDIYSDSSLLKRKYVISSDVYKVIPSKIEKLEDSSLPAGKTVFVQPGHDGYGVKVTMNTYEDKKLVGSEIISNDVYDEIPGVRRVSTKK